MSIVKRNNPLFPSLMNEFFRPDFFGGMETLGIAVPAVNIKETEKDFELELAIPGRKKEDFNIEVDKNELTISAEKKSEDAVLEKDYTRREFTYDSFKRVFSLPETVDVDKINASYENGILKFTLPKKEEALPKPKKLIEIA